MKPVRFHPALDPEVAHATRYHEERQPGLGHRLLEAIEQTTNDILRGPSRCQLVTGRVRKRRLTRFPYTLIFEDRADYVYILALMHDRRHPDYWKSRIDPA